MHGFAFANSHRLAPSNSQLLSFLPWSSLVRISTAPTAQAACKVMTKGDLDELGCSKVFE